MVKKEKIPKEILNELHAIKKKKEDWEEIKLLVEDHQARIPIPKKIRLRLNLKKKSTCKMKFDPNKKELIFKF